MSTALVHNPIETKARELFGRLGVKKIRRAGRVPVNLYGGGSGQPNLNLSICEEDVAQFMKAKRKILKLALPGGGEEYAVFQQIEWDTTLDQIIHIDLLRAPNDKKLEMSLPLRLEGLPVGASKGGTVKQSAWELRVKITPPAIPADLEHDISSLEIGQSLRAGDVSLPKGAELVSPSDLVIVAVEGAAAAPKAE